MEKINYVRVKKFIDDCTTESNSLEDLRSFGLNDVEIQYLMDDDHLEYDEETDQFIFV